jgi:HEAT repeat protein
MAIDVTVVNELSALLRRHEQDITRARVLARLQRESSPALTALFVERLNEDASEMVRITAAEALGSRLDEPGVRYALERAATGDAIGAVRQMATYSLEGTNDRRVFTAGVERR